MRNTRANVLGVVLCIAASAALAQDKSQLNTIKKVVVRGGTVEISGSKKPSFTTFPMSDPPRFVIDISEAVFSGVPDDVDVPGGGRITAIKTASYGSDASAIARVVIGFDRDVEPDVQTSGNTLVIKVGAGAPPAVASSKTPTVPSTPVASGASAPLTVAQAGPGPNPADPAAAQAQRKAQEKADREAKALAEAERKAQEKTAAEQQRREAQLADQQKRETEVARQREAAAAAAASASATAAADAQRKAQEKADREAQARAAADRKAQDKAAREAQARADTERKAQEKAEREAQARAEAQRKAQEETSRKEAAEQKRRDARLAEQQRREADAAQKREAIAAAAAAAGEKKESARLAREQAQAARSAPASAAPEATASAAVAVADTRAPSPVQGNSAGGAEVSGRRKTVTLVGFSSDKSRVYVRTNEPVRYNVSQADDKTIVLELENTAIARHNDSRTLDTRFFGGPVVQIAPQRGRSKTVRVSVTLRDKVEYQARQDGNEVSLQFAP